MIGVLLPRFNINMWRDLEQCRLFRGRSKNFRPMASKILQWQCNAHLKQQISGVRGQKTQHENCLRGCMEYQTASAPQISFCGGEWLWKHDSTENSPEN